MTVLCFRCGKKFDYKVRVLRHLSKKKPCEPRYLDITHDEVKNNFLEVQHDFVLALEGKLDSTKSRRTPTLSNTGEIICHNEYVCEFCDREFNTNQGYYRHRKHYCKYKRTAETVKAEISEKNIIEFGGTEWIDSWNYLITDGQIVKALKMYLDSENPFKTSEQLDSDIIGLMFRVLMKDKIVWNVYASNRTHLNMSVYIDEKWEVMSKKSVADRIIDRAIRRCFSFDMELRSKLRQGLDHYLNSVGDKSSKIYRNAKVSLLAFIESMKPKIKAYHNFRY